MHLFIPTLIYYLIDFSYINYNLILCIMICLMFHMLTLVYSIIRILLAKWDQILFCIIYRT